MSTPANAVPSLVRADASGALFFSLDGGLTYGSATSGGTVTAGTNIAVAGSVVSTVLTGFLGQVNSTDSVGATQIFKKSRGTSGTPLIVAVGDIVAHDIFEPYDGVSAAYVSTVDAGAYVTPGATLTSGVIPTSYYRQVKPDGVLADPGNSSTRVFEQVLPVNPINAPTGGAVIALNFPGNTTFANLQIPGGTNAVATISSYAQTVTGPLSSILAEFRNNSAGTPTHCGSFGWTFTGGGGNTAGAEQTFYEMSVMEAGTSLTAMIFTGNATGGQMQIGDGSSTVPGLTFLNALNHGFSLSAGSGNDFNINVVIGGVLHYQFFEAASSAGNEPHYLGITPSGSASCGFTVRGTTLTGMFYENINGGLYLDSSGTCVQIGPSGYKATNSTSGFLALSTVQGTPTGVPGFNGVGKSAITYDETGGKLWVYNLAAAAWKSVALN